MITTFQTQRDLLDAVAMRLGGDSLEAPIRAALVTGITEADQTLQARPNREDPSTLNLRLGRWFIRHDDLPLLDALATVGASVASFLSDGSMVPAAVVAGLTSLSNGCWQVWRKGGRLTQSQVRILGLLETHGPLPLERITEELGKLAPHSTDVDYLAALRSLEKVKLYDGTFIALVCSEPDGTWRALRVI